MDIYLCWQNICTEQRNVFGLLYPAYLSFVAVKNKDVHGYVQWMMYWIVFAFYSFFESFTDTLLGPWFPFYYELKILMLLWLMSPATRGATIIYRRFIHPNLLQYEPEIDLHIASVKNRLGSVFWTWAGKLLNRVQDVVTETIWNTAVRVRENDFMRRAVSLHAIEHQQAGDSRPSRSTDNSPTADGMDINNYISERMKRDMFLQRNMAANELERMMESDDGMVDDHEFRGEDQEPEDDFPPAAPVDVPRTTRARRNKKENNNATGSVPARVRKPRKQVIAPRSE